MRTLSILVLVLLTPQAWAAGEYWEGDNYLECLVGKGIVALRHGATVDQAMKAVREVCTAAREPARPMPPDAQEWDEYIDAMHATAYFALEAVKAAQVL